MMDSEFPPMNAMQKKFLVHVSISFVIAILFGCTLGFVAGYRFFKDTHVCPVAKKHAVGYSVVDSNTIKTCCGEIKTYQWNRQSK
jgi:hypothetical protein